MSSKLADTRFLNTLVGSILFYLYAHVKIIYISFTYIIMLKLGRSRLNQGIYSSGYYGVKFYSQKSRQTLSLF